MEFKMDPTLILHTPPPLDPAWLDHEKSANLLAPAPVLSTSSERQQLYASTCRKLNTELLSGRDKHLTEGIKIHDTGIETRPGSSGDPVYIPIRSYKPSFTSSGPPPPAISSTSDGNEESGREIEEESDDGVPIAIYYHGGGLYVGDLDSEDLTCRRVCKELQCTVYSVEYRLMPEVTASTALADAIAAFRAITASRKASRLILMGSSSGGQLAAQVSQRFKTSVGHMQIHGVLLRGPVTCDATEDGANLPPKLRECHTSMSEDFHTSLLSNAAVNSQNRTKELMPLEVEDLSGMPRHWIQVSTNDIYYSDGACYAEALRRKGVDVKLDVVVGWPHTFWLKAPFLERAVMAERDMIEGLRWLLESESEAKVEG
ncbi:alpha/beta hydrolase fold-domain-containing protein [Leptodontidium sp. MPI-SDFR-AT-0119]|nr:alpha/beta hydrolase fold-domain-containing protein [Leptodontidium sp. MPI-SDFR-AT-0119]